MKIELTASVDLDHTDRSLLNILQAGFPLSRNPFREMGSRLGIGDDEVIERARRLKARGLIRNIGPIFNPWSLGYQTTLLAMSIDEDGLERAASIVSQHPGVSHNYQRDHRLNLWFTLAVPKETDLAAEVQALADRVAPREVLNLPTVRQFKIGVYFDMGGGVPPSDSMDAAPGASSREEKPLSVLERVVVEKLQQDLPLEPRPFDALAAEAGIGADEFIACCRSLAERGVMRRFGASIRHHNAGFTANAMGCWVVPDGRIEEVGARMAAFKEVSHCYQRPTAEDWPFNLFTMIHGKSREECHETAGRMSLVAGVPDYRLLFGIREFKKERVKYRP